MSDLTGQEKKERHRAAAKAWAKKNPERVRANKARWAAANPERIKEQARKTARKRNGLVNPTGETRVGPCENVACSYVGALHLDHDHTTGLARGWLCGPCNRSLGLLKEDTARIQGLAGYLVRSTLNG